MDPNNEAAMRPVYEAMIRFGGGFVKPLGVALRNTSDGVPCIEHLAKCVGPADEENRAKILNLLKQADRILEMNQADRVQLIADEFPEYWKKYQGMAERAPEVPT